MPWSTPEVRPAHSCLSNPADPRKQIISFHAHGEYGLASRIAQTKYELSVWQGRAPDPPTSDREACSIKHLILFRHERMALARHMICQGVAKTAQCTRLETLAKPEISPLTALCRTSPLWKMCSVRI